MIMGHRVQGGPGGVARERDEALCRSLIYEALALGFRAPGPHTEDRLMRPFALALLAEAGTILDEARGTDLAGRILALPAATEAGRIDLLEEARRTLFGFTARGPVPPYETEYGDDTLFQKPQEIADIAGFFMAFGLVPDPRGHERLDHVCCELEFLAVLARKEAHALEIDDAAMLDETRRATRLFLRDHLGRFFPSFSRRVLRSGPERFHGLLAGLGLEFIRSECARLDVHAGPETLRLRLPLEDLAPMGCGSADACAPGSCAPHGGAQEP